MDFRLKEVSCQQKNAKKSLDFNPAFSIIGAMDEQSLKKMLIRTIESRATKNRSAGPEIWDKVEKYHSYQEYITLDLIAKSLNFLPQYSINQSNDWDLVVFSQLIQRLADIPLSDYPYSLVKNTFGFSDRDSNLVKDLCLVKSSFTIQDAPPFNLMHDANLIRIAFPYDTFFTNQFNLVVSHKGFKDGETFYLKQVQMFEFLLRRGKFFSLMCIEQAYASQAEENIQRYCSGDTLDFILDSLSHMNQNVLERPINSDDSTEVFQGMSRTTKEINLV